MPNRDDIVMEARSWLDVKWRHQGRTRNGIDCAGLVILIGKKFGLTDYDTHNYKPRTNGFEFVHHFRDNMDEKKLTEAVSGDVILFRDKAFPCHTGILSDKFGSPHIIHAYAPLLRVVEMPFQAPYTNGMKPIFCFQYRGIENG